jgi:hypothetical protein
VTSNQSISLFERVMAALPGWMLLLAGGAMVAMVTLVPAWVECRQLSWQTQVMKIQSQELAHQQKTYETFREALKNNDPVVVERMAYYHLRLKPVGARTLDELDQPAVTDQDSDAVSEGASGGSGGGHVWRTLPTIEDLLARPMLQPGQYCPQDATPDSRMVRLATGPARHVLLAMGVLCLFFGLLPAGAAKAVPVTDTDEEIIEAVLDEDDDSPGQA